MYATRKANNNERFNALLNHCKHPRRVYAALLALAEKQRSEGKGGGTMKSRNLAWAVNMECTCPPEHYQMRSREVRLFIDASDGSLFRAVCMAYNYGFQRGQNMERNSRKKARKGAAA